MALEMESSVASNISAMLAAVSSEDEEMFISPKQKRVSQKKKKIISDDESETSPKKSPAKSEGKSSSEEEEEELFGTSKKRHSRLVKAKSSSDDSDEDKKSNSGSTKDFGLRQKEKISFAKLKKKNKLADTSSDEEELMNRKELSDEEEMSPSQMKSMNNMRAEFGAESSDEENGRGSSMSNKSNKSRKGVKPKGKKSAAPKRKSAVACRAAMEKERQKMVSENQRMVRESMASLPYHRPKQRSLKEFLSARPRASLELKGVKPSSVDISVVEKELEETEKHAEEFYKQESEEEEERFTPPPPVEEMSELPKSSENSTKKSEEDTKEPEEEEMDVDKAKKILDFNELEEKLAEIKEKQEEIENTPDAEPIEKIDEPAITEINPALGEGKSEAAEQPEVEISKPAVEEKEVPAAKQAGKLKILGKEAFISEFADACLTPGDAAPDKLFAVPAPPKENNKVGVEDSLEEEIHLYLEDSADIDDSPKLEPCSKLDILKLYEMDLSSDEDEKKEDSPVKPEISPIKKPATRKELMERLKNSKPVKLQGSSSDIIDLTNSEETTPNGIEQLMERFVRHVQAGKKKSCNAKDDKILDLIKAGEKMDDRVDLTARPGTKMSKFKSELQESIAKQRVEDFNQRQKEYKMYDDETDELLGNDFGDDEKEEKEIDEIDHLLANETESEPESETEEYADRPEKPRVKSAFVDEEAEVSEPEEAGDLKEDDEEEEENPEAEDCEGDDENEAEETDCDESTEDEDDGDDLKALTPSGKKNFSRIIRVADSDDEEETTKGKNEVDDGLATDDNDKLDQSFVSNLNTSVNLSLLDSPGQGARKISIDNKIDLNMMGDLCGPTQPVKSKGVSYGITQMFEDGKNDCLSTSFGENAAEPNKPDITFNLGQMDETQKVDLADLCSGQFPQTQDQAPKGLQNLIEDDNSTQFDMADLCSGQFVTQTQDKVVAVEKLNNVDETQNLEDLCSGQFVTQPKTLGKLIGGAETQTQDLAALCSGQFVTQDAKPSDVPQGLSTLVQNGDVSQTQDLADLCSGNFETQAAAPAAVDTEMKNDLPEDEDDVQAKFAISSDEEDGEGNKENTQSQKRKKKKKKKRKLDFSDDEEDEVAEDEGEEEEEEEAVESDVEKEADYSLVDYDSEENEVVVQKPGSKKSRATKFFEAEAELSGSDWGSADEDERDLDDFEEELGDKEVFDEDSVKQQLGTIHARRMLDDDKREIRLFQDAFLEDGDLHTEGGGRQRSFRWKNTDDGNWEGGCNPNLSGDEGLNEDEEDDASWRTARLERETWLKEQSSQELVAANETENSKLLSLGKNLLAKINGAKLKPNMEGSTSVADPQKRIQPMPLKSPGKAILQTLQGKSGSFFSRTRISLSKMVAITGSEGDVVTTSKRNFNFTTISPSNLKGAAQELADSSFEEASPRPVRAKKRKSAESATANPRAKKHKVTSSIFKLM